MDLLDVCRRLASSCDEAGSQRAWAMQNSISPQYVCDVLNARREPGDLILRALGLRRVVTYAEARIKGKAA